MNQQYFVPHIDISTLLQVELISRRILRNLDCQSLLNARLVSSLWEKAVDRANVWKIVLDNDAEWKKLYSIFAETEMSLEQEENYTGSGHTRSSYRNLYSKIKKKKESLEKRWVTEDSYRYVTKLSYPGYVDRNNLKIKISEKFILRRKNPHVIELFNRWNGEAEHVIDVRIDNRVMMKSADMTNDFLAVGANRGQIFVWCLKSQRLIHKLDDDPTLLLNRSFADTVMASRVDCNHLLFNPNGTKLLSCIRNNSSNYETLTIRKLSLREAAIIHQETIHQFIIRQIHIDDSHIFILGTDGRGIQVRCANSLNLINIIAMDSDEPFIKCFKPYGEWVITGGRNHISLWSAKAGGGCFRRIHMDPTDGNLKTIGLVGHKYIVTCHVICFSSDFYVLRINVWSLTSFFATRDTTMKPEFTHTINTKSWHDTNMEGIRDSLVEKLKIVVDDFQITSLLTWEYDFVRRETPSPMLYFIKFLN